MTFAGHTHSQETKDQLAAGMRGKAKSAAHAKAISDGLKRRAANGGVSPHGTPGRYKSDGCRCPECRTAWRDYKRSRPAAARS